MRQAPTLEQLRRAPKVLLHDHLDGGLRPATVIELARETDYTALPTTDVDELARWFTEGAARKDLVLYLETFDHTVGVMQTKDALLRVAQECAEDLAADGVVTGSRPSGRPCRSAEPSASAAACGSWTTWPVDQRLRIINQLIKPAYAQLRASGI